MHMPAVNDGKYIKSTKRGEQHCPAPVSLSVPKNSLNLKGFNWMQATKKAGLIKLFEVASLIALKGSPFSEYSSLLEIKKILQVKFLEKCEHRNSCREFIDYANDYLFDKDVKNKLLRTYFIGVLNDGTTDDIELLVE